MTEDKTWFSLCLGGLTLVISACASVPTPMPPSAHEPTPAATTPQETAVTLVPEDISRAILPPLNTEVLAAVEPRINVSANNMPARQIFLSLVEKSPYEIMVHPSVSGNLTLELKKATIPEIISAIHDLYGYEYRREGKRFFILPQGLQTQIFPVDYLSLNRKGRSDTRISSATLQNSGATSGAASTSATTTSRQGVEVQTASESDFWKELASALTAIIGTEEGRHVVVHPQASIVLVKAMPAELRLVKQFLGVTQSNVHRQVLLEAKILEVELSDHFQAGINWAAIGRVGGLSGSFTQTGGNRLLSGSGVSDISGAVVELLPTDSFNPVAAGATSAFGGMVTMALKANGFTTFLELLKTQGEVRVLSSPRVATVNNQKAVIKVGGDEFFVTGVTNSSTSSSTTGTTASAPSVELTPFFSGIALDVTPQIDERGNVLMHIHPTVSNVDQKSREFIIGDSKFSLPLAFSTIQESDNVVRARNGEVIVIGGLMKESNISAQASVPALSELPWLGRLFKHNKKVRVKKELVILLRPTVENEGRALNNLRAGDLGATDQVFTP